MHYKDKLIFSCTKCNKEYHNHANKCNCGASLFKVARMYPLMQQPIDPYRSNKGDPENGYFLQNLGDNSTSAGGAEAYDFPQDGGDADDVGTPNAKSDDILQENAMRDTNRPKNDYGVGVHTMNADMPTSSPSPSVFRRTKSKLQYNYTGGQ